MANSFGKQKNNETVKSGNFMNDIDEPVWDKFCMVSCSQRCDCGYFKPNNVCMSLDICHNCMWAKSPYVGSEILYCSKKYC